MREDSPEISIIQHTFRFFGLDWAISKLKPIVRKIINCKHSLEIDPSRLEVQAENTDNLNRLLAFVTSILDQFSLSTEDIPSEIIQTCGLIQESTEEKFPHSNYRGLAAMLFLRFLCPIIVSPESNNITKATITPEVRRRLILVTKTIQAVVNGADSNESYMDTVNEYVLEKQQQLNHFYEQVLKVRKMKTEDNVLTLTI